MSLSAVFGGIAAGKAAKNERKTQQENLDRFYKDRQMILDEFYNSRGRDGTAFLPEYFGTGDQSFEKRLADDYRNLYTASDRPAADRLADFNRVQAAYMPMMDAARGSLGGVFDGTYEENRLNYARPVMAARTDVAKTGAQGVLQALNERINALNASSAKKGYSGTGSFAQNRLLNATIPARQQAAAYMAMANLENAADERGIRDGAMDMKLNNLFVPGQLAAADAAFVSMPETALMQQQMARMRPAEFFRIGTAMPNIPMTPMQNAIPTSNQIFWQTTAQATKEAEDLAKQAAAMYFGGGMGGMMGGGGGGGGGSGINYLQMPSGGSGFASTRYDGPWV